MARSPQPYWPLLAPLIARSFQLALPQTFFQPDEFYQALEPAHRLVFGYGHLTWEWRDLPIPSYPSLSVSGGVADQFASLVGVDKAEHWMRLYDEVVVGGRMRGWLWPGTIAAMYKILAMTGQEKWIASAPRVIGMLVAVLTDLGTYKLASKLLGPGAGATALFLSLTSLFNAHALPRLLSTSPETMLVVWALVHFPLPAATAPKHVIVGEKGLEVTPSMKAVKQPALAEGEGGKEDVKRVASIQDYDYSLMDRVTAPPQSRSDSILVAATLATLAICIRPTTLPFWVFLGLDYALRSRNVRGVLAAMAGGLCTLAFSTYIDYRITGRLIFPILTFTHHNLLNPIAAFYGATDITYHLVQSIPILTFPLILPFLRGFLANLLHTRLHVWGLDKYDRPAGLRVVTRATAFAIAALSLSTHSEWRFLHPFLPVFLTLMVSPLSVAYTPTILGSYRFLYAIRQYLRISKLHFYLALLGLLPYAYLTVHGRAQVEVMNVLRRGELGQVRGLVALMPCHSTPWSSHLHQDVPGWFLTCEPPIGIDSKAHVTQQSAFYADPQAYIRDTYPSPPLDNLMSDKPSHILLFGHILPLIGDQLAQRGYVEVWHGWNGFDLAQDEAERRGGVRVWQEQAVP